MPPRAHRLLIPLAAFLAILPLLLTGPSCGHDFDFHLLNWLEANTQLTHFQYPRWAYTPAFNAGEPRFLFYPPLSWLLGAALTEILPFHFVPIAFTFLALTLSGFTLHRFARDYATPAAATFAAILYLLNPYMLFTAYERTAYAELLAAAFIPLLFAAILRPRPRIPAIALPVALLWLTNAPAAVMSSYALALLTLIRLALGPRPKPAPAALAAPPSTQIGRPGSPPHALYPMDWSMRHRIKSDRPSLAITSALGTLLGLLLAAFYIVPAAYERRFVAITMAVIPGMAPADNFLFHHTALAAGVNPDDAFAHDAVLHTASLIAILLLTLTAATLLLLWTTKNSSVPHSSQPHRNEWEVHPHSAPDSPPPTFSVPHSSQPHRDEWDVHPHQAPDNPPPALSGHLRLPLTLLAAAIAILLTPISLPIWTHTPQLAFLQFPWRLLALLTPITALTTALALSRLLVPRPWALVPSPWSLVPRPWALVPSPWALVPRPWSLVPPLLFASLLIPTAWHAFHQSCDTPDTPESRAALYHSPLGTEPTDEYTPTDADPDALHPEDPPFWLIPPNAPINTPAPSTAAPGPTPNHLLATGPGTLILNRRQYPLWQITLNNRPIASHLGRNDGLIAIPIPPGPATIDLHLRTTRDEILGLALSILAALILLALFIRLPLHSSSRVDPDT